MKCENMLADTSRVADSIRVDSMLPQAGSVRTAFLVHEVWRFLGHHDTSTMESYTVTAKMPCTSAVSGFIEQVDSMIKGIPKHNYLHLLAIIQFRTG